MSGPWDSERPLRRLELDEQHDRCDGESDREDAYRDACADAGERP